MIVVEVVEAGAAVAAGLRRALVDVDLAVGARVAGARALARVPVQGVRAPPAVLARLRLRPPRTLLRLRDKATRTSLVAAELRASPKQQLSLQHRWAVLQFKAKHSPAYT